LKDCVSTRKTSLQPKGFSLAGVSKNSAGTKKKKKEHEDEEGRRWKKGGVLRPPPIAGRPVHLFALIFYTKNFLTGFCFYSWVTLFITLLFFSFLLFLTFLDWYYY
jgi:hypothetical protein